MVQQLIQDQASTQSEQQTLPTYDIPPREAAETINDEPAKYLGSTHWSTIVNDLHDLKTLLQPEAQDEDEVPPHIGQPPQADEPPPRGEPIFGAVSNFSLQEIIYTYLPAKVDVDRLLSSYFQGPFFIVPFLHKYHFQRQCQHFWTNTSEVKPLWLSILFSICYLSAEVRKVTDPTIPPVKDFPDNSFLHTAAGQCLVLGEYNRPQESTVESLVMYAQSKHMQSLDPSREAGDILSIAVRSAYHLGYHRDPESGSFSVFEGEMRRRCWAICKQMDLMTSFELGLPSNICLENCDTKSPRNLFDRDFDESTTELPPSRSEHEATRQLWFIVKDRMMDSFSKVCRDALSFNVKSESDILELDQEIRKMYDTIPDVLRTCPLSESVTESSFIIFTRYYIEFIYLKCLCVLHRRYMARGNEFSTTSCINAGKRLVSQFIEISKEFAPGGQLYQQRWMLTNYTMNDSLLGVMVLCFAVYIRRRQPEQSRHIDDDSEREILELLTSSQTILIDKSAVCKDARRVSHIVRLMLDGVKGTPHTKPANTQSPSGVAQNIELAQPAVVGTDGAQTVLGPLEPFNFMNNPIGDLDWSMFDHEMFNQDTY